MLAPDELALRIKAARALAQIPSTDALAERIGSQGLSGATLRKIEAGVRPARVHEVREIARATALPFAFFDLERPELVAVLDGTSTPSTDVEDAIAAIVPELEDRITERVLRRLNLS